MGMGSEPCGGGLCGLDTLKPSVPKQIVTPSALRVDGATKDFVQTSDGQYASVHPVDAQMFNLCRIAKTSIGSATAVGQDVRNSRYLDRRDLQARVDSAFQRATQSLVDARKVRLLGNEIQVRGGTLDVRVNYQNLATGKRERVPVIL